MTELLPAGVLNIIGSVPALATAAALATLAAVATTIALARQRAAMARLDDRVTHLAAGLSLLTNTTEEGLRAVAVEIGRLAAAPPAAPAAPVEPAAPEVPVRQRVATAAGHGRSVKEIAAAEGISESEVLLHLLIDRMHPETTNAEVC